MCTMNLFYNQSPGLRTLFNFFPLYLFNLPNYTYWDKINENMWQCQSIRKVKERARVKENEQLQTNNLTLLQATCFWENSKNISDITC